MTSTLDALEAAKGGPFRYSLAGSVRSAPDPVDMDYREVFTSLHLRLVPGAPNMPNWLLERAFRAWTAHHDLPPVADAQRLAYVIDRYRNALEIDLRTIAKLDLGEEWRSRRWRSLLNTIDHLPRNCWYSEAVSNDEEHAEMIRKALEQRGEASGEPAGPPMHIWSQEVSVLTDILDAVRRVEYATVAVQVSDKNKAPQPPKASPRPVSILERAQKAAKFAQRQAKHDALARRLLPHKA